MTRPMEYRNVANLINVGLLICFSGVANAQSSVTLYGWTDAGIQYRTGVNGHSAVNEQSYGLYPDMFGVTGTEDIGGGLKAIFKLEQAYNINDGSAFVPGVAFFRSSYVGLTGPWGAVTFGRQFSVLFDGTLFYDATYYGGYSGQAILIPGPQNFGSNSIKYKSPKVFGFTVEALAATDGVAGNTLSGRTFELGMQYEGNLLDMSGVIHQVHGSATAGEDESALQTTIGTLAAQLHFGPAVLIGGVERQSGSLSPQKTVAWAAARYAVGPDISVRGGIYKTFSSTPSVGHPTYLVGDVEYDLSKRTGVYLNVAYSRNSAESTQSVYEYDTTALPGSPQTGVMLGMFHKF
jgi:predicted porin